MSRETPKEATRAMLCGVRLAINEITQTPSKRTVDKLLLVCTGLLVAFELAEGIVPPPQDEEKQN